MVDAGFSTIFIGIETPDEKSLEECAKFQNQNRGLVSSVDRTLTGEGIIETVEQVRNCCEAG